LRRNLHSEALEVMCYGSRGRESSFLWDERMGVRGGGALGGPRGKADIRMALKIWKIKVPHIGFGDDFLTEKTMEQAYVWKKEYLDARRKGGEGVHSETECRTAWGR